jgi:hypothetical protein
MKCENISELLIEYMKGELNSEQCILVETHLQDCEKCREELHLLRNAFCELQNFSAMNLPFDASMVAEKARIHMERNAKQLRGWWMLAATGVALVGVMLIIKNQPSPITQATNNINPIVNPVKKDDNKQQASNNRIELPRIKKNININKPTNVKVARKHSHIKDHPKVIKQNQPSTTNSGESGNKSILVAQIDTLTQYLMLKDGGKAINCSVVPVVAGDDADQAVADTLTAAMICKFRDKFGNSAVNRTTLINVASDNINNVVDEAKKSFDNTQNNYLVVGTVKKSKYGYLFSVDIINGSDNSIINTNNHPVLIPDDSFKTAFVINKNKIS